MSKNRLFNFIQYQINKSPESPIYLDFKLAKNLSKKRYYRLDLPRKTDRESIIGYELITHHLSIFETEARTNPFLSQYHYTAFFKNQEGNHFKLHVYFDSHDEIAMKPVFLIEETLKRYKPFPSDELNHYFIDLAKENIVPLLKIFRLAQTEVIERLENRYYELEKEAEALFETEGFHSDIYFLKLDEICTALSQLIPLTDNNKYLKIHCFVSKLKERGRNLDKSTLMEDIVVEQPLKKIIITEKEEFFVPLPSHSSSEKNQPSPKEKEALSFETQLQNLIFQSKKIKVKETKDSHLSFLISHILTEINALSCLIDENTPMTAIQQLKNLHQEIQEQGQKIFPRILINGELEAAAQLVSFHDLIEQKHLNFALQMRNIRLLEFILTYGHINLSQPVKVQHIIYPSAVTYCFDSDSPSNPMKDCLSVLIKHGASLCVPSKSGLPVAYFILNSACHPLRSALAENLSKTFNSIEFYKALEGALLKSIEEKSLHKSEQRSVSFALQEYRNRIELLSIYSGNRTEQFYSQFSTEFEERNLSVHTFKLTRDPIISRLLKDFNANSKILLDKLDKKQQRQFHRETILTLNKIENIIKLTTERESIDLDLDATASFLEEAIQQIQRFIQFIDLNNELRRCQPTLRPNRRIKKIFQSAEELKESIVAFNTKFNCFEVSKLDKRDNLSEFFSQFTQDQKVFGELKELLALDSICKKIKEGTAELENHYAKQSELLKEYSLLVNELSKEKEAREKTEEEQTDSTLKFN